MTKHIIPEAALDKHVALLGMTGSGKTSVIKTAIVEPDLEADRRVLIITPKDDWWGLRLSKTGKSKGFDIPIFGGWHADYPLNVKDAELLAETYGTMKGSAIFCTSRLSVQDRAGWFAAFADRLLHTNKGWVRVVIDEAHVFMPKQGAKGGGKVPLALHAGNELVSQGRSLGLRIVLASQRSAKLHNDSLTQCSCLFAMLLMAPHDREAVKDWIEDQADPQRGKEIIASLATLNPGQAWVWAPGAKFLECVQFPRPATFDSSAAPDDDSGEGPKLTPINLDALQGKLAKVEADRKASDPKALRAEIARLTAELQKAPKNITQNITEKPDKDAIAAAEKRGFEQAQKKLTRAMERQLNAQLIEGMQAFGEVLAPLSAFFADKIKEAKLNKLKLDAFEFTPSASPAQPRPARAAPVLVPRAKPVAEASGDGTLPLGEKAVLKAVAQYPDGVERERITILTGYKRSTRDAYILRLGTRGFVDASGRAIRVTQEGLDALGPDFEPLPTGQALQDHWMARLPDGERKVLACAIEAYPGEIERDEIGERTGYKRSTRDAYLQRLSVRRLIVADRGAVKAADLLFDQREAA